ncbi:MAG: hypothetical protein ABIF18_03610 [archaeon]
MVKTIYDLAVEKMKDASREMVEIIGAFAVLGRKDSLISSYSNQREKLENMGIWQEKYDVYATEALSGGFISKESEQGLAKIVEGIIE